ncbi:MAG: fumarylacetoacetate hydrolase [Microbacteriaceae bacterium]|nr:fumarylacetoacetate hydrolase [Microbacteriaceae bacterium]
MKLARVRDRATGNVMLIDDGPERRIIKGVGDVRELIGESCTSLVDAANARGFEDVPAPVDVDYLSPLAGTGAFRDFYAFEQHVKAGRAWRGLEMDPDWYKLPVFYFSNPYAIRGAGDVTLAPGSERFDFELEVGAILGRGGSNLTPEQGAGLVVGYTVLNDWSARDIQKREMLLSMGPVKGKDTATTIGPWVVTPDELDDVRTPTGFDLRMTCTVNGTKYSDANWSQVYWSFGEMIAYASRGTEVRPGDLIGSGTCGTGCINELSQTYGEDKFPFLKVGDVVEAEVERLGVLRNTITAPAEFHELRPGIR